MPHPDRRAPRAETGAITIMVALMLLVLLTIAAIGMSRNSFREIINSGFSRQGAMASSLADSGLEWSLYWIEPQNSAAAPAGGATNLVNLKANLLLNPSLEGIAKDITDPTGATNYTPGGSLQATMTLPAGASPAGVVQGYTLGLTSMGKVDVTGMSSGAGPGTYSAALGQSVMSLNLWAIRADAQVVQNGVTFTHGKEAWVATPIQ